MMKTILFYLDCGRIVGRTVCADDHADMQGHPHTENALILDGIVEVDALAQTVVDGQIVDDPPRPWPEVPFITQAAPEPEA